MVASGAPAPLAAGHSLTATAAALFPDAQQLAVPSQVLQMESPVGGSALHLGARKSRTMVWPGVWSTEVKWSLVFGVCSQSAVLRDR
jgi:hypothetical protein